MSFPSIRTAATPVAMAGEVRVVNLELPMASEVDLISCPSDAANEVRPDRPHSG
jgi:hypothetical protein